MRVPKYIKPGDTIGLVAPSFGAAIEPYVTRLAEAVRKFEARGYRVRTADSCYKSDGLGISTNPADAARDVEEFYLDESVDALISVGGGELMNETISRIDFKKLAEAPAKWFMGYSDNTNFILPMATLAGVAGIYGPCATGFGKPWEETEEDAFAILEGRKRVFHGYDRFELPEDGDSVRKSDPLARYVLTQEKVLTAMVPTGSGQAASGDGGAASSSPGAGRAAASAPEAGASALRRAAPGETVRLSGLLLGGCLDVLENLSGTEFDDIAAFGGENPGIIWVLEACDLNPMAIRRTLWHLRHQGWFDTAAGFLVGRPLAAFRQDMMGVNPYNAVTDMLEDLRVPIIFDADVGHVSPMLPLVIGAEAEVTARDNDLTVEYRPD